jgi:hypothetical protein
MLLMLGWVGGKAKSSREPLLNKKRKESGESHSTKERKKVQQHMRQPWSDKSNFADLNCRMFVPLISCLETES